MLASLPLVQLCRERKKSVKRRQDRVRINLGIGAWIMIIQVLKKTPKSKSEVASILAQGMAKAEGDKKLSESLTPEILKAKALEKWDGAPPKRILIGDGNESMMIQLPATQQVTVPAKAAPSKT